LYANQQPAQRGLDLCKQAIAKAEGVTGNAARAVQSTHAAPTQAPGEEGSGGADPPRPYG
jgi:hypothetical protein